MSRKLSLNDNIYRMDDNDAKNLACISCAYRCWKHSGACTDFIPRVNGLCIHQRNMLNKLNEYNLNK